MSFVSIRNSSAQVVRPAPQQNKPLLELLAHPLGAGFFISFMAAKPENPALILLYCLFAWSAISGVKDRLSLPLSRGGGFFSSLEPA